LGALGGPGCSGSTKITNKLDGKMSKMLLGQSTKIVSFMHNFTKWKLERKLAKLTKKINKKLTFLVAFVCCLDSKQIGTKSCQNIRLKPLI
jgi:hypothetical protein